MVQGIKMLLKLQRKLVNVQNKPENSEFVQRVQRTKKSYECDVPMVASSRMNKDI